MSNELEIIPGKKIEFKDLPVGSEYILCMSCGSYNIPFYFGDKSMDRSVMGDCTCCGNYFSFVPSKLQRKTETDKKDVTENKEYERKFTVNREKFKEFLLKLSNTIFPIPHTDLMQGYLFDKSKKAGRVRLIEEFSNGKRKETAFLTIKNSVSDVERDEWEYEIPYKDGTEIFTKMTTNKVYKKRYKYSDENGFTWEIDVFEGNNRGLVLAEVEFKSLEKSLMLDESKLPDWIDRDVTGDTRFLNSTLAKNPWKNWSYHYERAIQMEKE